MANIYDFSITFRGTNNQMQNLETVLTNYLNYLESSNYGCGNSTYSDRQAFTILIGKITDPTTRHPTKNETLGEIMPRVDDFTNIRESRIDKTGQYYTVNFSAGHSWQPRVTLWVWMADKYGFDFELFYSTTDGQLEAGEYVYVTGILNETHVELEAYDEDGEETYDYGDDVFDEDGNKIEDVIQALEDDIEKCRTYNSFDFKYIQPCVSINCETNYLDNLKTFVDNNLHLPNIAEHLVKSGLFRTSAGKEKRKRIEVEINGIKLFADSKPSISQRKSRIEKLKNLLSV
ncbi:hypothetical protein [Mucilaginibacter sp.]|uniref:hypothetical protein n=1 Tax=Mucilaginibacter sp. TaxID=1882438 RepID=UPI0025E84474|nr:hypothetical protein [Mucilaginibacter sp.]